jgi:hypothetical protein
MAERDGGHLPMTTDLLMKERGKEGGDWRRRTWSAALDERKRCRDLQGQGLWKRQRDPLPRPHR